MEQEDIVIEMSHITKDFPGIRANDDVTLQLRRGEIHALLGENGAGKSTLMSILFGMYQPDSGTIYKDGEPVTILSPNDATDLGIGMVHQHFKLVECFSLLDNIILGAEDSRLGFVTKKKAREKVNALMDRYGLHVDLDKKVSDVSVGIQQRTEILKMLYRDNEILIFDEPTAVLTPQEIEDLMQTMRSLAKEGKSILFISHKLNEIMEVADRCTVLRKGKCIGTVATKDTNIEELAEMMVGRNVSFTVAKEEAKPGKTILDVKDLVMRDHHTKKNTINHVSFDVREGEIVALAGIDGNGQNELVQGIAGLMPIESGSVIINGVNVTRRSIHERIRLGMSYIPEDRHKHGLVLDFNLEEDFVLQTAKDKQFAKHGIIKKKDRRDYANELIEGYDVRSGQGSVTIARSMSGGNQQKAIVARELDRPHCLLIACQPTRGLDVGAIEDIHKKIIHDRDKGTAVFLVSFELDEIMNLADRIYVIHGGELVGELDPKKTNIKEIGLYMAGAKRDDRKGNQQ